MRALQLVVKVVVAIPAATSVLLLSWSTCNAGSLNTRSVNATLTIAVGDKSNHVRAGDIWLQSYSWNGGERFRVGSIVDGRAKISLNDSLSSALVHPSDPNHDNWVIIFYVGPESLSYTTKTLNHQTLFSDFTAALESVGKLLTSSGGRADVLVLPAPEKRTITFINLNGAPVIRERVDLFLHVSNGDHCGVEQGPLIGEYTTDSRGKLAQRLPPESLTLEIGHFEPDRPRWWQFWIVVGPQKTITLRRNFRYPPERNWNVIVKLRDGSPVTDALVSSYYDAGCGGPGPSASTNARGEAVLRLAPRITGWVAVSIGHKTQQLTIAQRATLEKTGKVTLVLSQRYKP